MHQNIATCLSGWQTCILHCSCGLDFGHRPALRQTVKVFKILFYFPGVWADAEVLGAHSGAENHLQASDWGAVHPAAAPPAEQPVNLHKVLLWKQHGTRSKLPNRTICCTFSFTSQRESSVTIAHKLSPSLGDKKQKNIYSLTVLFDPLHLELIILIFPVVMNIYEEMNLIFYIK